MVSSGVGRLPSTLTSKFANHWHILGSRSRISDMLTKPLRNQVQSYSVVSSRSNVDTAANKELYLDHNSSKVIMSGWLDAVDDGNTADRWAHVLTSTNAGTVLDRDTSTRCLLALMDKQANPELGIHHTLNSITSSSRHRTPRHVPTALPHCYQCVEGFPRRNGSPSARGSIFLNNCCQRDDWKRTTKCVSRAYAKLYSTSGR
jgi:hypothetical protein